jgi:isopentenyldiphosphate isomerase
MMATAQEELIEQYTPNGEPMGIALPRSKIHREGIWHNTVTIWIILRPTGQLLIQKRSATKDSCPNKWDASCAGHIPFGQSREEAAVRELWEELGLDVKPEQLQYLGRFRQEFILNNGQFIDNEWIDLYLLELDHLDIHKDLKLQREEVSDVALVHYSILKEMYDNNNPKLALNVDKRELQKFWNHLAEKYPITEQSDLSIPKDLEK